MGLVVLCIAIAIEIAIGWHCKLQGDIQAPVSQPADRHAATAEIKNYFRPEDDTFLSYPEWYIVWSYQEKAGYQEQHLPSGFPYFGAVRQYWGSYCCISRLIRGKYPFNLGEQVMLVVIGTSFSAEYILKGAYEKTLGRVSEWTSGNQPTSEDQFAYRLAREYAEFVHVRPFYEFHFAKQVRGLWSETGLLGPHFLRKWERKLFLTADYSIEAFYCWVIEELTHLSYGFEPSRTYAWIATAKSPTPTLPPHANLVKQVGAKELIVDIPRYQEFTTVSQTLASQRADFIEIAGNSQILISLLGSADRQQAENSPQEVFSMPVLTRPGVNRKVYVCNVSKLSDALREERGADLNLEHVYDY